MNYVSIAVQRAARIAAAFALTAALAGCIIASEKVLVTPDEGVTPLPAKVYLFGYNDDKAGGFARAEDPPMLLSLDNKTYKSADGTLNVQFLPSDKPDTYVLAVGGPDGGVYGMATLKDSLLQVDVILADPDVATIIKAENAPVLADVKIDESAGGGMSLTSREQLDYVLQMVRDGKLKLSGMVMFAAESDTATVPAKISPDGSGWWKTEG
jgi:hypothetical protein